MKDLASPSLERLVAEFNQSGVGELRLTTEDVTLHLRRGRQPRLSSGQQKTQPDA